MKLDESERSATTRLMKVKDMMIEKTIRERHAREQELDAKLAEEA